MENFITLFLVVLGIGFIGEIINNVLFNNKQIKKSKIRSNENIYREKTLMTNTEKNFYQKLKVLEPKYKIIPQVNLGTIIEKISNEKFENELFRNIDYGIFTNDFSKVLLLIELNDQTHNQPQRKKRDIKVKEICNKANIPIMTFYTNYPNNQEYVINRILNKIENNTDVNVNIKMHKKGKISVYKKGNMICPNCVYSLQTPLWFKTSLVR